MSDPAHQGMLRILCIRSKRIGVVPWAWASLKFPRAWLAAALQMTRANHGRRLMPAQNRSPAKPAGLALSFQNVETRQGAVAAGLVMGPRR